MAVAAERLADAPVAGTAKVMTPPSTGSTGLIAVTVTASGLANGLPVVADCGVLPATGVRVKPWLWKAPMSTWPVRGWPRWSVVGMSSKCRRRRSPGCPAAGPSWGSGRRSSPGAPAAGLPPIRLLLPVQGPETSPPAVCPATIVLIEQALIVRPGVQAAGLAGGVAADGGVDEEQGAVDATIRRRSGRNCR